MKMEQMEIGNLLYAEIDGDRYVGAEKEWCRVERTLEGGAQVKFVVVNDQTTINRLYLMSIQTKFAQFESYVVAHLKKSGRWT
jgi:hypothetical protein